MSSLVQQKFGQAAADYATSSVHAAGPSLSRLVELIHPKPTWRHLDIACGAGHTALAFAPKVAKVTASDVTPEMLAQTRTLAKERKLGNVVTAQAPAHNLPFPDTSFHLVTCRLAAHHFRNPQAFVREAARVLIPGGVFALVDNISPDDDDLAAQYNAFEKLRDPSHGRCLTLQEWQDLVRGAGLEIVVSEVMDKDIPFEPWIKRMRCSGPTTARLKEMLEMEPLRALLKPHDTDEGFAFTLPEAIVIAEKPKSR